MTQTIRREGEIRHHSFRLTRPSQRLIQRFRPEDVARGWVRLVGPDGTPLAIRSSSITEVAGPAEAEGGWVVELATRGGSSDRVEFDSPDAASRFVDELLHED